MIGDVWADAWADAWGDVWGAAAAAPPPPAPSPGRMDAFVWAPVPIRAPEPRKEEDEALLLAVLH